MPRVPTKVQNVQQAAIPQARVGVETSLENFGGGQIAENLAGSISKFGKTVFDEYRKVKEEGDKTLVKEQENELIRNAARIREEINKKKGKDAKNVVNEANEMWGDVVGQLRGNLKNDRQTQLFDEIAANKYNSVYAYSYKHGAMEIDKYETEVFEENIKANMDDAILNYDDVSRVTQKDGTVIESSAIGRSIKSQEDSIRDFAARKGKDEEWVKNKTRQISSKTHRAVIERMLNQENDVQAETHFNAVKDNLTGNDLIQIEDKVLSGKVLGESRRETERVLSLNKDPKTGKILKEGEDGVPLSSTEMFNELKKIKDTKIYDKAVTRLTRELRIKKDAQDQANNQMFEYIFDKMARDPKNFDLDSPEVLALPSDKQNKIYSFVKSGGKIDPQRYLELITMPRDKLLELNLFDELDRVSLSGIKEVIKIKNEDPDTLNIVSAKQRALNFAEIVALKKFQGTSKAQKAKAAKWKILYAEEIHSEINKLPKEKRRDPEEMEKIHKKLQAKVLFDVMPWKDSDQQYWRFKQDLEEGKVKDDLVVPEKIKKQFVNPEDKVTSVVLDGENSGRTGWLVKDKKGNTLFVTPDGKTFMYKKASEE